MALLLCQYRQNVQKFDRTKRRDERLESVKDLKCNVFRFLETGAIDPHLNRDRGSSTMAAEHDSDVVRFDYSRDTGIRQCLDEHLSVEARGDILKKNELYMILRNHRFSPAAPA
jgi:hypothetical protein